MASTHAIIVGYLRGLAVESARLCQADGRFPGGNPLRFCSDRLLAHMVVREVALAGLVERYEAEVRDPATELHELLEASATPPAWWTTSGAVPDPEERLAELDNHLTTLVEAVVACGDERSGPLLARLAEAELGLVREREKAEQRVVASFASAGAAESAPSAEQVSHCLGPALPDWDRVEVREVTAVAGLHSREVYIAWLDDGADRSRQVVIRRDRPANLVPGSVIDEHPIMKALHERGLPVPEPLCSNASPEYLGRPYVAMSRLDGTTPTAETFGSLGDAKELATEIAVILAGVHAVPIEAAGLRATGSPAQAWRALLDEHDRWWQAIRPHPSPVMEWARSWLHDNVEVVCGDLRLVHGDYHLRNFLIADGHVTGLLDFELAKVGHAAEDLGAIRSEVEAAVPWEDFLAAYQAAGGVRVTPAELAFCDVWAAYRYRIICGMASHLYATGESGEIFFTLADHLETPRLLADLVGALRRSAA